MISPKLKEELHKSYIFHNKKVPTEATSDLNILEIMLTDSISTITAKQSFFSKIIHDLDETLIFAEDSEVLDSNSLRTKVLSIKHPHIKFIELPNTKPDHCYINIDDPSIFLKLMSYNYVKVNHFLDFAKAKITDVLTAEIIFLEKQKEQATQHALCIKERVK